MADQQKRRTLKILAGAGAGVGLAALPPAGHAAALVKRSARLPAEGQPELPADGQSAPLQIDIMAGNAVPGDTVIIRNTTPDDLAIEQFHPSVVTYKDSMFDMSTLLEEGNLHLAPKQIVAVTVTEWQLLAAPQFTDYLWADETAIELSKDTRVIQLNGTMQGRNAVLSTAAIYS